MIETYPVWRLPSASSKDTSGSPMIGQFALAPLIITIDRSRISCQRLPSASTSRSLGGVLDDLCHLMLQSGECALAYRSQP
jgi:hypothetical protein